jgi:hypothetical protein
MQPTNDSHSARDELFRRIGRNVVNFQYLEATLRSIVEIATATGSNRGGSKYVAVSGPVGPNDNRIVGVDLRESKGSYDHQTAFVFDYVKVGLNAPSDFEMPDNLALDKNGNLYITEDPATAPATGRDKAVAISGQ